MLFSSVNSFWINNISDIADIIILIKDYIFTKITDFLNSITEFINKFINKHKDEPEFKDIVFSYKEYDEYKSDSHDNTEENKSNKYLYYILIGITLGIICYFGYYYYFPVIEDQDTPRGGNVDLPANTANSSNTATSHSEPSSSKSVNSGPGLAFKNIPGVYNPDLHTVEENVSEMDHYFPTEEALRKRIRNLDLNTSPIEIANEWNSNKK